MKLFSSQQMRDLDRKAAEEYAIPGLILMEHAAHEVALNVLRLTGEAREKKVMVVCGPGNNGGDGFAAARILHDWGFETKVFLAASPAKLKGDAQTNYEIVKKQKGEIFQIEDLSSFQGFLKQADIIVDALFGTGLKNPVEGELALIINAVNEAKKNVVAVDLPSGIDSDTGKILGTAMKATVTVTLAAPKVGLSLYPGKAFAGEVRTAYISIPQKVIAESPCKAFLAEKSEVASWLPVWKPDIHKGERGRVMIIGGSRGLSGAPSLSTMAALESGAGLVYIAVPDGIRNLMEHKITDAVKVGLPQTKEWVLGKISLPETRIWFEKIDSLAIGPGIGRAPETLEYVKTVVQEYQGPLLVDADGLYALDDSFLEKYGRPSMVLTPHEGEMARLCGMTPEEIRQNRLELASEKARKWNCIVLLKGAGTIVASPEQVYINPTGNPGMAVGGSGDVLTGILAALLGQQMDPLKAAVSASFIHGRTGDIMKCKLGLHGITATKMVKNLFKAFKELETA